jgi:hypothetical protein
VSQPDDEEGITEAMFFRRNGWSRAIFTSANRSVEIRPNEAKENCVPNPRIVSDWS